MDPHPIGLVIVDDDEDVRGELRTVLADQGFDIYGEAGDGLEAVAAVEELSPDVVVMDIRMPNMDGLRATREIRRRYPSVHVVILSVYNDPGLQDDADEVGAAAFLVKGCSPAAMKEALVAAANSDRGEGGPLQTRW